MLLIIWTVFFTVNPLYASGSAQLQHINWSFQQIRFGIQGYTQPNQFIRERGPLLIWPQIVDAHQEFPHVLSSAVTGLLLKLTDNFIIAAGSSGIGMAILYFMSQSDLPSGIKKRQIDQDLHASQSQSPRYVRGSEKPPDYYRFLGLSKTCSQCLNQVRISEMRLDGSCPFSRDSGHQRRYVIIKRCSPYPCSPCLNMSTPNDTMNTIYISGKSRCHKDKPVAKCGNLAVSIYLAPTTKFDTSAISRKGDFILGEIIIDNGPGTDLWPCYMTHNHDKRENAFHLRIRSTSGSLNMWSHKTVAMMGKYILVSWDGAIWYKVLAVEHSRAIGRPHCCMRK